MCLACFLLTSSPSCSLVLLRRGLGLLGFNLEGEREAKVEDSQTDRVNERGEVEDAVLDVGTGMECHAIFHPKLEAPIDCQEKLAHEFGVNFV